MFVKFVTRLRRSARRKRAKIFHDYLAPAAGSRVLDLGGGDGSHIRGLLPDGMDVYVADIDPIQVHQAEEMFGYTGVVVPANADLPFPDKFFDVVFCSSVIEHVTWFGKAECWSVRDGTVFRQRARTRQTLFAREIRRVGKHYFVQTPDRWFPIESHSWIFGLGFLPRSLQVPLISWLNGWWVKKTSPDWSLLSKRDMGALFPDARIVHERWLAMSKSLIAVK